MHLTFRTDPADSAKDPGKVPLDKLYRAYLRHWRPVLVRSLGVLHAKHHKTWSSADGEGGHLALTLFPGYWSESRRSAFVRQTFQAEVGASDRQVRKAFAKHVSDDDLHKASVAPGVWYQQLHHTESIHKKMYRRGLRNQCNDMQLKLLDW